MSRLIGTAIIVWLVAAIAILSPPSVVKGQVPMTGAGLGAPSSGGGFTPSCSQSSTFLTAATGVTLTADKTNYDTMICGLVTDGNFSGLDVLYIFAAPTQSNAALINLANPGTFNGTTRGTVSFTAYQGYTGDASTFYVDSGFNPSTASSPNFVQNSATVGVYDLTNRSSGGNNQWQAGNGNTNLAVLSFGAFTAEINSGTSMGGANSNANGSYNMTRTSSSLESIFENSSETAVTSASDTSQSPSNANIVFFGDTPALFSSDQLAAGWIGKGVTAVNSCKINNRINTYMASLSSPINVYSNSAC